MARIRTIKPEFWTSGQVLECSTNARLMFIGLWNFCDDTGRHPLRPKQIKAQIFPADDFTQETILGMVDELSRNGLITIYNADGEQFFYVNGWHHQRIDKPQKPKYPDPKEHHSENVPGTLPPDRKGKDRKGKGYISPLPPSQNSENIPGIETEQPDIDPQKNIPIKTPERPDRDASVLWQRYTEIQAVYPGTCNSNHDFHVIQSLAKEGVLPDQSILLERVQYEQKRLERGYVSEAKYIPSLKKWLSERQWGTVYPEEKELQRVMSRPEIDWDSEEMNQPF